MPNERSINNASQLNVKCVNQTFNNEFGWIASPNFLTKTKNYAQNLDCFYEINLQPNQIVQLRFKYFNLNSNIIQLVSSSSPFLFNERQEEEQDDQQLEDDEEEQQHQQHQKRDTVLESMLRQQNKKKKRSEQQEQEISVEQLANDQKFLLTSKTLNRFLKAINEKSLTRSSFVGAEVDASNFQDDFKNVPSALGDYNFLFLLLLLKFI